MASELIVVGARLNSSRLPKKHLLPLAGIPLISRLLNRLQQSSRDPVIVLATTADEYNKELVDLAVAEGVDSFAYQGDVNDLVGRVNAVVERYQPERLVYICGDCPLIEPALLDRLFSALAENPDWDSVNLIAPDGDDSIHEGFSAYSLKAWQEIEKRSTTDLYREHVELVAGEENFLVCGEIPLGEGYDFSHRISVDSPADYRFMNEIYRRWYGFSGEDSIVDLAWVVKQLKSDGALAAINAHVMQKSGFRRYGNITIVCEASKEKGLGQLRRCIRIAERIQEEMGMGLEVLVLGDVVELSWMRFCHVKWFDAEQAIISYVSNNVGAVLIADLFPQRMEHPDDWKELFTDLKNNNVPLLGIDHLGKWHEYFDLVVVPSIFYDGVKSDNIVFGPEYILVDACTNKQPNTPELMIFTGGSDIFQYGATLPLMLDKLLPAGTVVKWVVGPYAESPNLPKNSRLKWSVLDGSVGVEDYIASAHTALAVYGTTVYELLASMVPTAVLPAPGLIVDEELSLLEKMGVGVLIRKLPGDLNKLASLLGNETQRVLIANSIKSCHFGGGAARVVKHLAHLMSINEA